MRDMRENLVELFARVKVNLPKFTGEIAGRRANLRTLGIELESLSRR